MNKAIFFLLVVAAVMVASAGGMVVKYAHKKLEVSKCKIEMVEVTKTQDDLTWIDLEPMCK